MQRSEEADIKINSFVQNLYCFLHDRTGLEDRFTWILHAIKASKIRCHLGGGM